MLLIAAHVVPVWMNAHVVSQDGPAHVQNALLLRDLFLGHASGAVRQVYEINRFPEPNWLGHLLLASFAIVASPSVAEKLLVSMYVIALPCTVLYAIVAWHGRDARDTGMLIVSRASRPCLMTFLIFPFIDSLALHKGVYNFCLGLPLFFLAIGLWHRRRFAALGVVLTLLYFAHIIPFGMAVMTIGVFAMCDAIRNRSARPLIAPVLAALPGVVLAGCFFMHHRGAEEHLPMRALLIQFVRLDALVSFTAVESLGAMTLAALIAALLLLSLYSGGGAEGAFTSSTESESQTEGPAPNLPLGTGRGEKAGLLIAVVLSIAIYFLAPNSGAGGGQVSFRLSLFPFFLAMLCIAANLHRAWIIHSASAVAAIISFTLLVDRTHSEGRIAPMLEDYAAVAAHIEPDKTLWTIYPSDRDATSDGRLLNRRVRPFVHANGLIAASTGCIDLTNYEAETDYFPIRFRDREGYSKRWPEYADYVMVWQSMPNASIDSAARDIVTRDFDEVFKSPLGFATLYRARARR